jgi:hypothetical protein
MGFQFLQMRVVEDIFQKTSKSERIYDHWMAYKLLPMKSVFLFEDPNYYFL